MSLFSRRARRGAIAAVGVGLLVATCAAANGAAPKSKVAAAAPVTMSLWTNATTGPGTDWFNATVKSFEAANPNVTINMQVVQNEDYDGKLQTALQAGKGTAPDILFQRGGGNMDAMINAGQLAVYKPSAATKKAIPASTLSFDAYKGKDYAEPVDLTPGGFFYSRKLFKQAGIKGTPKTLAALESDDTKLKKAGITPVALGAKDLWPAAHWYYWIALRECSQSTLSQTATSLKFSNSCWTKAGNILKQFNATKPFEKGFLDTPAQTGAGSSAGLVANHKAAMELSGAWDPGVIGSLTPNQKPLPDLSYFPFPSIPGGQGKAGAMMGGADAYSCSAWAPEPACNNFLNYMVTAKNQKTYSAAFQSTPVVSADQSSVTDRATKLAVKAANGAPYSSLWFDTLYGSNVGTALNTAVVDLLAGKYTPAQVVSAANEAALKG